MRELGQMTPEERQVAGPKLERAEGRDQRGAGRQEGGAGRRRARRSGCGPNGWTSRCPRGRGRQGTIHPVSQVTEEVTAILADMGFAVAEGPQVETDWYNFDALNIPATIRRGPRWTRSTWRAPTATTARRMCCARTPRRCRSATMADTGAPMRVIAPGRVYRADYDQTHTPMFHQVEGLAIDRDIVAWRT